MMTTIKRRYLALVRAWPPDREPEKFQALRRAYEAVSGHAAATGMEAAAHQHRRLVAPEAALPRDAGAQRAPAPSQAAMTRAAVGLSCSRPSTESGCWKESAWTRPTRNACWSQFRLTISTAMDELPETPSDPGSAEADLFSVFVELAAVRNEVRTESRLVKEALDQFRGVFDTLRSSQATLQQELQRAQAEARERGQALLRPLLLDCWNCATGWTRPCNNLPHRRSRAGSAAGAQPRARNRKPGAKGLASRRAGSIGSCPIAAYRDGPGRPAVRSAHARVRSARGRTSGSVPAS